jgi:predicted ATP-dependent serine protease
MADQPAPAPLAVAPSLVGRDREQATLRAALDEALAGRGALVLIGGEAGIGKTTWTAPQAPDHEASQLLPWR